MGLAFTSVHEKVTRFLILLVQDPFFFTVSTVTVAMLWFWTPKKSSRRVDPENRFPGAPKSSKNLQAVFFSEIFYRLVIVNGRKGNILLFFGDSIG